MNSWLKRRQTNKIKGFTKIETKNIGCPVKKGDSANYSLSFSGAMIVAYLYLQQTQSKVSHTQICPQQRLPMMPAAFAKVAMQMG